MIVKWQFDLFCQRPSGDLIRPAHNKLSLRPASGHTPTAVPLGCGQLGSGVGAGGAHAPVSGVAPL